MTESRESLDITFKVVLIICIISLIAWSIYLFSELKTIEKKVADLENKNAFDSQDNLQYQTDFFCSEECLAQFNQLLSKTVATLSGKVTTKTVVEKQTVISTPSGTDYIPMGTSATTTSTDWVDVDDSAVYIDVENDYGKNAVVSWEASLKVAHGNGKAFARLYDETNKIAVDFSEVSSENNADFITVSSGNLPFWKGNNLYKVQIKSLNSFVVTYSGGKVIIRY